MIDLNNIDTGNGVKIFNDGKPGRVLNVTIKEVTVKQPDDHERAPDFNIMYADSKGNILKDGFYLNIQGIDEADLEKKVGTVLGRLVQIVKALLGDDYKFPDFGNDYKVVMKGLFTLINDNKDKGKVNLFVCFGTKTRPSNYLNVRYFGKFIEPANTTEAATELLPKPSDMMTTLVKVDNTEENKQAEEFFKL